MYARIVELLVDTKIAHYKCIQTWMHGTTQYGTPVKSEAIAVCSDFDLVAIITHRESEWPYVAQLPGLPEHCEFASLEDFVEFLLSAVDGYPDTQTARENYASWYPNLAKKYPLAYYSHNSLYITEINLISEGRRNAKTLVTFRHFEDNAFAEKLRNALDILPQPIREAMIE